MENLQTQFINLESLIIRTSLSRSSLRRLMNKAAFPQPYSINGVDRRKVWKVEEVDSWMVRNTTKVAA